MHVYCRIAFRSCVNRDIACANFAFLSWLCALGDCGDRIELQEEAVISESSLVPPSALSRAESEKSQCKTIKKRNRKIKFLPENY